MTEMALTGEEHRQMMSIRDLDDLRITEGTARLNNRGNSRFGGELQAVRMEKNASDARTLPMARSPAFRIAMSTESTRLIWPAPTPTSDKCFARTMALDLTCLTARHANARFVISSSVGSRSVTVLSVRSSSEIASGVWSKSRR